ncbi:MAG TPA: flagellar biosynthesis anti-sigma factor FlgM [Bryobacteraceae bacterium]|nr:flagellar biosynthesis anti-sigma factor FlgM [Bryobacteraceae bacterium]
MRIVDNNNLGNTALGQTARTAETQPSASSSKAAAQTGASSQPDELQLSSFAGKVTQGLHSDSTNRSQRVAQLAAAVQSGTYKVDPAAVSHAIVEHELSADNKVQ